LLKGIPKNRAQALVRSVFRHINRTIAGTEDGVLIFAGLGRFRMRKVERELEGRRVSRTRIIFRHAEPGARNRSRGAKIKDA
jgi:nucleoid DNA-binding protein